MLVGNKRGEKEMRKIGDIYLKELPEFDFGIFDNIDSYKFKFSYTYGIAFKNWRPLIVGLPMTEPRYYYQFKMIIKWYWNWDMLDKQWAWIFGQLDMITRTPWERIEY